MLGVVGLGKLGLPLALVFCKFGFHVKGVDISKERIDEINKKMRFLEPKLNDYLQKYSQRLQLSTDYNILKDVPLIFIVVQTPSLKNEKFDLKFLESAVREVHKVNSNALVVVSSTINIGDMDQLHKLHQRICYNPEFIAQGSIVRDFENPKFVLIGALSEEDGKYVANVWKKIHKKPIFIVKPVEAEIAKLSLNVSFTLGITYANIIGELSERLGADPDVVMQIIHSDVRKYRAGLGFGGPCFPRDTTCFGAICSTVGVESGFELSKLLNHINEATVERYTRRILSSKPRKIAFIGIGYKQGVGLVDESQSIKILRRLLTLNPKLEIFVYDRLAEEMAKKVLPDTVFFCESLQETTNKADVIFIGVPNSSLPEDMFKGKKVIDPWRCIKSNSKKCKTILN